MTTTSASVQRGKIRVFSVGTIVWALCTGVFVVIGALTDLNAFAGIGIGVLMTILHAGVVVWLMWKRRHETKAEAS